jgi:hypothetical protein
MSSNLNLTTDTTNTTEMSGDAGGVLSLLPRIFVHIFDEFIVPTCSIIFNIKFNCTMAGNKN